MFLVDPTGLVLPALAGGIIAGGIIGTIAGGLSALSGNQNVLAGMIAGGAAGALSGATSSIALATALAAAANIAVQVASGTNAGDLNLVSIALAGGMGGLGQLASNALQGAAGISNGLAQLTAGQGFIGPNLLTDLFGNSLPPLTISGIANGLRNLIPPISACTVVPMACSNNPGMFMPPEEGSRSSR